MSEKNFMKKSGLIDISRPLSNKISVWPGAAPFKLITNKQFDADGFSESSIQMNIHTGTHIDAPMHFLSDGKSVEALCLEKMIGEAQVVEYTGLESAIDIAFFKNCDLSSSRILIKTRNSSLDWIENEFDRNFVALSADAAQWLADQGVDLIGVDGPSVQLYSDLDNRTHEVILEKEVIILEGLNLSGVNPGKYQLFCAPLKIRGAEGAPARAVLIEA